MKEFVFEWKEGNGVKRVQVVIDRIALATAHIDILAFQVKAVAKASGWAEGIAEKVVAALHAEPDYRDSLHVVIRKDGEVVVS